MGVLSSKQTAGQSWFNTNVSNCTCTCQQLHKSLINKLATEVNETIHLPKIKRLLWGKLGVGSMENLDRLSLFNFLEDKGLIALGNYGFLQDLLKKAGIERLCATVQKTEDEISKCDIHRKDSSPSRKRKRDDDTHSSDESELEDNNSLSDDEGIPTTAELCLRNGRTCKLREGKYEKVYNSVKRKLLSKQSQIARLSYQSDSDDETTSWMSKVADTNINFLEKSNIKKVFDKKNVLHAKLHIAYLASKGIAKSADKHFTEEMLSTQEMFKKAAEKFCQKGAALTKLLEGISYRQDYHYSLAKGVPEDQSTSSKSSCVTYKLQEIKQEPTSSSNINHGIHLKTEPEPSTSGTAPKSEPVIEEGRPKIEMMVCKVKQEPIEMEEEPLEKLESENWPVEHTIADKIFHTISTQMSSMWRKLAVELGLDEDEITNIASQHPDNEEQQCVVCLQHFFSRNLSEPCGQLTAHLVSAVYALQHPSFAATLCDIMQMEGLPICHDLIVKCQGGLQGNRMPELPPQIQASVPQSSKQVEINALKDTYLRRFSITPEGGQVNLKEVGVFLLVPPGALAETTEMFIGISWRKEDMPPLPQCQTRASPVVVCGPHGLTFRKPVFLSFYHCISGTRHRNMGKICPENLTQNLRMGNPYYIWQSQTHLNDPCQWKQLSTDSVVLTSNKCVLMMNQFCKHTLSCDSKRLCAMVFGSYEPGQVTLLKLMVYCVNDTPDEIKNVTTEAEGELPMKMLGAKKRFKFFTCEHRTSRSRKEKSYDVYLLLKGYRTKWKMYKDSPKKVMEYIRLNENNVENITFVLCPKMEESLDVFVCKINIKQEGIDQEVDVRCLSDIRSATSTELDIHWKLPVVPIVNTSYSPESVRSFPHNVGNQCVQQENIQSQTERKTVAQRHQRPYQHNHPTHCSPDRQPMALLEVKHATKSFHKHVFSDVQKQLNDTLTKGNVWDQAKKMFSISDDHPCPQDIVSFVFSKVDGSIASFINVLQTLKESHQEGDTEIPQDLINQVKVGLRSEMEYEKLRKNGSRFAEELYIHIGQIIDYLFESDLIQLEEKTRLNIHTKVNPIEVARNLFEELLTISPKETPIKHLKDAVTKSGHKHLADELEISSQDVEDELLKQGNGGGQPPCQEPLVIGIRDQCTSTTGQRPIAAH